jgi:protein O-GlcNAc transferase
MADQDKDVVSVNDDDWRELEALLRKAMEIANEANFAGAVDVCRDAISKFPSNAEPYFILAVLTMNFGDEGQAIKMAEVAHNMDPDTREYVQVLATVSTRVGRLADGVYYAKIAHACEKHPYLSSFIPSKYLDFEAAIQATRPSMHGIEGERLFNEAGYEAAFREFNAEIRLNPENVTALVWLARTAIILGHFNQAVGALQAAIRVQPTNAMAYALLARALIRVGRSLEAESVAFNAIKMSGGDCEVYLAAMEALQLIPNISPSKLRETAVAFNKTSEEINEPDDIEERAGPIELPHIGFVSNAFFRSNAMELAGGWFAVPISKNYRVSGYHQSVRYDETTTNVQSGCDEWRDIYGIDPFTLSMTLRAEEIDVLVDVSQIDGETRGAIMGLNPSPVRVGFCALPEPGLAPGITHVLSDPGLAKADRAMLLDGQSLVEIRGTLFPHLPIKGLAQDTQAPVASNKRVTLGAYVSLPAASPEWAIAVGSIIRELPEAQLILFGMDELPEYARSMIREYFMHTGIVERVLFAEGPSDDDDGPTSRDHLNTVMPPLSWAEIDLFLDTFPLTGRKELCEALWSGVPVISRQGTRRSESVGASILAAAGRPNWITSSTDEYMQISLELAKDPERLQSERADLQKVIASSSLFDPLKTATEVRAALVSLAKSSKA